MLGAMCHICPIACWINTLPFQVMSHNHWAVRMHKSFHKVIVAIFVPTSLANSSDAARLGYYGED